ncbi:hypothetical protein BsIDN1_05240 [Bacillus safensis]|uniref:Uncharacterized protein n=1 Tax=Bacillus safensis TaxID=561879 RepID=A0A5S9M5V5_BACIA|nr:hypothetical protein BsIDN1_05240 [Bacillus safensis]
MNSEERNIKIKINNVSKIFGKNAKKASQMLEKGKKKREILKRDRRNCWCQSSKF